MAVVEPLFLQAQREAAARYHQLAGTGLTSREPREMVQAAEHGRIDTLFASQHPAGPTGVSGAGGSPSPNGDRALRDVLQLATVTTLIKGATVYVLSPGEVPGGAGVPPRSSATRRRSFELSNWLQSER